MNASERRTTPTWWESPGQVLKAYQLQAQKRFSQNFLADWRVVSKIVDRAAAFRATHIVEIGPGLGMLTAGLASLNVPLLALDIDSSLEPRLRELETRYANLSVRFADGSDFPSWLASCKNAPLVVSNLPYALSGRFLRSTLDHHASITGAIYMLQREVALRLMARPRTPEYGALSVLAQSMFRVSSVATARASAFIPPPKVDSMVVALVPAPQLAASDLPQLITLVKTAFAQRRKVLVSNLKSLLPRTTVSDWLATEGFSATCRAEELSPEHFQRLTLLCCGHRLPLSP